MKQLIIIFTLIFSTLYSYAQMDTLFFKTKPDIVYAIYDFNMGIFNGAYTSFYYNSEKVKSQGQFKHNQRVGEWVVYDTLGNKVQIRNYTNNYDWELIQMLDSSGNLVIPDVLMNDFNYEGEPCRNIFPIEYTNVVFRKGIYRLIVNSENIYTKPFFDDGPLLEIIRKVLEEIKDESLALDFDNKERKVKKQNILQMYYDPSFNGEIISYELKMNYDYDKSRLMMDSYILEIKPTIKTEDMEITFVIPYEKIRPFLCGYSGDFGCQSMEDVFYYNLYESKIYKETNVYDKRLDEFDHIVDINEVRRRIEVKLIEFEHDMWLNDCGRHPNPNMKKPYWSIK